MPVWKTLRHNGVAFPPAHSPTGLTTTIRGEQVTLSPLGDEMAYQFAKKKDTPYVKDPVFVGNFMKDFSKELPPSLRGVSFSEVDFSRYYRLVDEEKRKKEAVTKDVKKLQAASRKEAREALKARYGKAEIDGKEVDIANWLVEPPGLFLGRGAHPLRGSWKPRVSSKDVTLNLDEDAPVPPGDWGGVVHDKESIWMARWIDKLTEREKYVWPHESSAIQQSRNREKYDKALRIDSKLNLLRRTILHKMSKADAKTKKIATVAYLIDRLGMRVGDEKDEDEADTVGATTLRVEHVKIFEDKVEFDFLGKDSVRWFKTIPEAEPVLLENLRRFAKGKKPEDEIFDVVTSSMVNRFLSDVVPDLTAKVFRTYHASKVAESTLRAKDMRQADDLEKLYFAKEANLRAAEFCNHKRTPPKNWDESLRKKEEKIAEYRAKGKEAMVRKMAMNVDFTKKTKDYNLNTSLKNYIDPRIYKSWCDYVGLDWEKLYSTSLQRKFSWVARSKKSWTREEEAVAATTVSSPQSAP
jgi:DNA topoisomerase-1